MTPKELERDLPHIGHLRSDTVLLTGGRRMAVLHLAGVDSELTDARKIITDTIVDTQLYNALETSRLEIWSHFTRQVGQPMRELPRVDNWLASRFDDTWRTIHGNTLARNDLWVSVIWKPETGLLNSLRWLGRADHAGLEEGAQGEFEDILTQITASLSRYGVRRLGTRPNRIGQRSEIYEALHYIMNNRTRVIGLSDEWMGSTILPDRIAYDTRELRIIGEHGPHYCAVLSPLVWPAATDPCMLDDFRDFECGLTIAHSWLPTPSHLSLSKLTNALQGMVSSEDAAESQTEELRRELDAVASRRAIQGSAHFVFAIHADSLPALDHGVAEATARAARAGITLIRETDGLKPGFLSLLPGNDGQRPRPAPIKSTNAVALSAKHNVPRGYDRSKWGAPVIMLRTTADTEYAFNFQAQGSAQIAAEDLASCILIGPAGSGKTGLLAGVSLLALRIPHMRVVIIDKGLGLAVMVKAAGGRYLVLPRGVPTGMAPLRALPDNEDSLQFLVSFLRGLILGDGKDELTTAEDGLLARAVAFQLRLPPDERSIAQVATMLGGRSRPESAAERLRRWCRGGRLGWVFDGEHDDIDFSGRIVGIDAGAFLDDSEICGPILTYLFQRMGALLNGDPILFVCDEAWQLDLVSQFRDKIKEYLKTIRKREGAVILATQSASSALKSAIADDYRQQIPTKIFFADDSATDTDLMTGLGLTAPEYQTVTQVLPGKKHTFLLHRPGGSVLCEYDLSAAPGTIATLSTRDSTYQLMLDLIGKHGDDPRAWVPQFERLAPLIVDEPARRHHLEAAE